MSECPPTLDYHEFSTTGNELPDGAGLSEGVRETESVSVEQSPVIRSQEDPISSPAKCFQSLYSSQGSKEGMKEAKMIPYIPPLKETGVVQFEDILSEQDCKCFDLIYELLLLEGKAGNLTDLAVGMVLAEKPPAWLPVIHGRLKHLIISSKALQEKKKSKYDARVKAKKLRIGKGKGKGKHSKGFMYLGISGKGKGKKIWPHESWPLPSLWLLRRITNGMYHQQVFVDQNYFLIA